MPLWIFTILCHLMSVWTYLSLTGDWCPVSPAGTSQNRQIKPHLYGAYGEIVWILSDHLLAVFKESKSHSLEPEWLSGLHRCRFGSQSEPASSSDRKHKGQISGVSAWSHFWNLHLFLLLSYCLQLDGAITLQRDGDLQNGNQDGRAARARPKQINQPLVTGCSEDGSS